MGTEATDVRLAWLEGAYGQIDKRLGTTEGRLTVLEGKVDAGFARLDAKIDMLATELRGTIAHINAPVDSIGTRLNMVMLGIVAMILVPILLRVFWP